MNANDSLVINFLSAYFNEDWDADAASGEDVVRIYLSSNPSDKDRSQLSSALLAVAQSGIDSERLFKNYGCYFRPEAIGLQPKEWLMGLAQLIDGQRSPM